MRDFRVKVPEEMSRLRQPWKGQLRVLQPINKTVCLSIYASWAYVISYSRSLLIGVSNHFNTLFSSFNILSESCVRLKPRIYRSRSL